MIKKNNKSISILLILLISTQMISTPILANVPNIDHGQIVVDVSISNDTGKVYHIPVSVDILTPAGDQMVTCSNDSQEYEATATFYVPQEKDNQGLIAPCDINPGLLTPELSGSVARGTVTLKYTLKDYAIGSTGILLNYVRVEYTILDSAASVTKVETEYWCKGGPADMSGGYISNQQATKVGYSSPHSHTTGFNNYVWYGNALTVVGCESVFYFKMGNTRTWTATVNAKITGPAGDNSDLVKG